MTFSITEHTHTVYSAIFPGEPGLAGWHYHSAAPRVLLVQLQILHDLLYTFPPSLHLDNPSSRSTNLHHHTVFHLIGIIPTLDVQTILIYLP